MLNGWKVIDADGHINDWHLDWEALAPSKGAKQIPTSVRDEHGFPHLEVEGKRYPGGDHGDFDFTDVEEVMKRFTRDGKYWLPRPGETDPALRLPDMDEMGIDIAVLFGGHCFLIASMVESPGIASTTVAC